MKAILLSVIVFVLFSSFNGSDDRDQMTMSYIAEHQSLAKNESLIYGIPASVILAQALVESNSGNSVLARRANNHFGIKCKTTWEGHTYFYPDDDRDDNGNIIASCFRIYNSTEESYRDHSDFLKFRDRYSRLFSLAQDDYKGWCHGLRECGYATDINYSHKLIHMIDKYDLTNFD